MITLLPDVPEVEAPNDAVKIVDVAHHNLAAVVHELGEHACAILRQRDDSFEFRAPSASLLQRLLPWTRKVYRVHCVGAKVYVSPRGKFYDLAHGSRESVMRDLHVLLKL